MDRLVADLTSTLEYPHYLLLKSLKQKMALIGRNPHLESKIKMD